jgi:hypothetical protein
VAYLSSTQYSLPVLGLGSLPPIDHRLPNGPVPVVLVDEGDVVCPLPLLTHIPEAGLAAPIL